MAETKEKQYITVSAGLALGIVLNPNLSDEQRRNPLGAEPFIFDLDFWRAWGTWRYAHYFPNISQQAEMNSRCLKPRIFVTENTARKRSGTSLITWEGKRINISPALQSGGYSAEEVAEIIHESIPVEAWVELADHIYMESSHKN